MIKFFVALLLGLLIGSPIEATNGKKKWVAETSESMKNNGGTAVKHKPNPRQGRYSWHDMTTGTTTDHITPPATTSSSNSITPVARTKPQSNGKKKKATTVATAVAATAAAKASKRHSQKKPNKTRAANPNKILTTYVCSACGHWYSKETRCCSQMASKMRVVTAKNKPIDTSLDEEIVVPPTTATSASHLISTQNSFFGAPSLNSYPVPVPSVAHTTSYPTQFLYHQATNHALVPPSQQPTFNITNANFYMGGTPITPPKHYSPAYEPILRPAAPNPTSEQQAPVTPLYTPYTTQMPYFYHPQASSYSPIGSPQNPSSPEQQVPVTPRPVVQTGGDTQEFLRNLSNLAKVQKDFLQNNKNEH